ncbi:MAG: NAD(P)H-binding protein [Proteobacteria bacterium]|nr:NAD(P)H-binding protein [Pseudomonadota bacterium]
MAHNIFLIGGTGGTGLCFLEQALEAGHNVTLYARNPAKCTIDNPNLRIVKGELTDVEAMKTGLEGCDISVFTAGVMSKKPTTVISDGVKKAIEATEAANVKRFIAVTSLGLGDTWKQALWAFRKMIVPLFIKGSFEDKQREEQHIMNSNLDWIIIRPARLLNTPPKRNYRFGMDPDIRGRVSRDDVAHFMMTQLDDDTFIRKTPGIAD